MLIPDWKQIDAFPKGIEPGHRMVVKAYECLAAVLSQSGFSTNVYVEPYFENHRPDVVVAIPGNGVLIVEVKDWNDSTINRKKCEAAQQQVRMYREDLLRLCGHDALSIDEATSNGINEARIEDLLGYAITIAVAVPFVTSSVARTMFAGLNVLVIGRDELLETDRLPRPTSLPTVGLLPEKHTTVLKTFWESLERWLVPPYHRAEQGAFSTHQLTRPQRHHAVARGAGWYRLLGPAGSGKTLVLAHKAAFMSAQGKRVLLICFNITLKHYLYDLIRRMPYSFSWENIAIRHFHQLAKEIRLKFDVCIPPRKQGEMSRAEYFDVYQSKVAAELLDEHPDHPFHFDAILIDEGQDFLRDWFQVVARCLNDDGELLLVRDADQNIYCRDITFQDGSDKSIRGLRGLRGFDGEWARLKTTWRMSSTITSAVSEFAHKLLQSERFTTDTDRKSQLDLYPGSTFCRWDNKAPEQLISSAVAAARHVTRNARPSHPSDFGVLTFTNDLARQVVDALKEEKLEAVHVYDNGKKSRSKMVRFRKGDGRIKVCTGHSFKGYELWGVIILVAPLPNSGELELVRWLYTCMGRAIEGLWVLNSEPRLNEVGSWFPRQ